MNNNDAVFEHIINQLREHVYQTNGDEYRKAFEEWQDKTYWVQTDKRFDVLIPWGKHRADVMREYIEHLEGEKQSLGNQLRDSSALVAELYQTIAELNDTIERYERIERVVLSQQREPEQAGCRKDDTQVEEPWIKWEGGECPVPEDTDVVVKFRDGREEGGRYAKSYRWTHNNERCDIVAYRAVDVCDHAWHHELGRFFSKCTKCGKIG